jgi:hypothetical protein
VLSALYVLIKWRKGTAPKMEPATSGGISHVSTSSAADKPKFTTVKTNI